MRRHWACLPCRKEVHAWLVSKGWFSLGPPSSSKRASTCNRSSGELKVKWYLLVRPSSSKRASTCNRSSGELKGKWYLLVRPSSSKRASTCNRSSGTGRLGSWNRLRYYSYTLLYACISTIAITVRLYFTRASPDCKKALKPLSGARFL